MTTPDWNAIKADYSAGVSARKLATQFGISHTAINKRANAEGWEKPTKAIKKVSKVVSKKVSNMQVETQMETKMETVETLVKKVEAEINNGSDFASLDLSHYGLNTQQEQYVREFLICRNKTEAYKKAGYKCVGLTAEREARRIHRNPPVNRAINDALDARQARAAISEDVVLKFMWDIAHANANDLAELRRVNCRHCWGISHEYQYIDEMEYQQAVAKEKAKNRPEPSMAGGFGFDGQLDPNPECPHCSGEGHAQVFLHDSRDVTGAARRLYAGAEVTKTGIKILTRNQDKALENIARHLGIMKDQKSVNTVNIGISAEPPTMTKEEYINARREMMEDDDC